MSQLSLSILIPVYNWDISTLIRRLNNQSTALINEFPTEIIVLEDGSTKKYCNSSVAKSLPLVKYEYLPSNHGRASLRNKLLERATGEFVLFLDADMLPDDELFLIRYYKTIKAGHDIICGGISYKLLSEVDEDNSFYLYKSKKTEAVSASVRNTSPWRYLFTSNMLIRRSITESVKFDSRFTGYGFEDIDLAIRLSKTYTIHHIDNTCTHMGLISKKKTFQRMRDSIPNYTMLVALHPDETSGNAIVIGSRILVLLPQRLLQILDRLLEKLFFSISSESISLFLFQLNKLVIFTKLNKTKR